MKKIFFEISDEEFANIKISSKAEKIIAKAQKLINQHTDTIRNLYIELEKINPDFKQVNKFDLREFANICDEFSRYTGENLS